MANQYLPKEEFRDFYRKSTAQQMVNAYQQDPNAKTINSNFTK